MSMRKSVLKFAIVLACFFMALGIVWQDCNAAGPTGTSSVYCFYNTQTGTHFFTISESEKDYIIDTYPQFTFEGVAWYAYPPNAAATDIGIGVGIEVGSC